jgi:hypothetical protein
MVEKYGFVYIWLDVKTKKYYVGCHWGNETDGYICSSKWMRDAYRRRPQDFRRRVIKTNLSREQMYLEEQRYFDMIKPEEIKKRYYNLSLSSKDPWHKHPLKSKTIGEKISFKKKGKSTGSCSPETAEKISKANKGREFSAEHKEKLRLAKLGKKHTEGWKQQNSERLKNQWSDGTRKRAEPKIKMSRQEQDALCSVQLKSRWSNADWKENQRLKLKEAWLRRKLNSIESQSAEI